MILLSSRGNIDASACCYVDQSVESERTRAATSGVKPVCKEMSSVQSSSVPRGHTRGRHSGQPDNRRRKQTGEENDKRQVLSRGEESEGRCIAQRKEDGTAGHIYKGV